MNVNFEAENTKTSPGIEPPDEENIVKFESESPCTDSTGLTEVSTSTSSNYFESTSTDQSTSSECARSDVPPWPDRDKVECRTNSSRRQDTEQEQLSAKEREQQAQLQYVTIANGIRFIILLICVAWCLFTSCIIIAEYWNYDTIVYLDYPQPSISKPPAITICTHCVLCSFNESIQNVSVKAIFDNDHIMSIKQAKQFKPNKSSPFGMEPMKDVEIFCTVSYRKNNASNLTAVNCTDLVPVVKSIQEAHKCYTFFSDIYGQVSRAIHHTSPLMFKFDQFPIIHLKVMGLFVFGVSTDSFDHVKTKGTEPKSRSFTGMYINLHDPTILPDMYDMAFHQVVPGKLTNIPFVKRVQQLLPSPYKTQCFEYQANQTGITERFSQSVLTRANQELTSEGLSIYRTRGECFLFCMHRLLNTNKCVNFYSIYTESIYNNEVGARAAKIFGSFVNLSRNQNAEAKLKSNTTIDEEYLNDLVRFCVKSDKAFQEYIRTKHQCLKTCPEACRVETFSEDNIIDENQASSTMALINIDWAPKAIINIVHRPKLDTPEFLGTLGGQAHIWLGISAIQIIWYVIKFIQSLEVLPDTSCCAIIHYWKHFTARPTD